MPEGKGLPPGNYRMSAWLGYKGPDGSSRIYPVIEDQETLQRTDDVAFSVSYTNVLGNELIVDPVYLDLEGAVCPQP